MQLKPAIEAFLKDYRVVHKPTSLSMWTSHLRGFARCMTARGRTSLHDLRQGDLRDYLARWREGTPRHLRASALRCFLRWVQQHYGIAVPLPEPQTRPARLSPGASMSSKAHEWLTRAITVAQKLHTPYQRTLFLGGFLHGLSFETLFKATTEDLLLLPNRADWQAELAETIRLAEVPPKAPLFAPWLGTHMATARRRWRSWAKGVKFREIIWAGHAACALARYRPRVPPCRFLDYIWLIPPIDTAGLRELPTFWEYPTS